MCSAATTIHGSSLAAYIAASAHCVYFGSYMQNFVASYFSVANIVYGTSSLHSVQIVFANKIKVNSAHSVHNIHNCVSYITCVLCIAWCIAVGV